MARLFPKRAVKTLAEVSQDRRNSVGFLRLCLASAVVISHAVPIALGKVDPLLIYSGNQVNVGTIAVYGFFVLSGWLITQSAMRTGFVRFLWHRALRILPGLWVCLLVTALIIGPLAAWHERGNVTSYFVNDPAGPFAYIRNNWLVGVGQWGIQDLFRQTPLGQLTKSSLIAGPQWSLVYEVVAYLIVSVLAITSVLKGARRSVVLLTAICYLVLVRDGYRLLRHGAAFFDGGVDLPLLGPISFHQMLCLGFIFLLGGCFQLYRERIPIHDGLGGLSAAVLGFSIFWGSSFNGFLILGLPSLGYLLLWLSFRLPKWLHKVGRKSDYSYGIYIYGFAVQQLLATFGAHKLGLAGFMALSVAASVLAGFLSWHLVEKWAMRLKDVSLPKRRQHDPGNADSDRTTSDSPAARQAEHQGELVGA